MSTSEINKFLYTIYLLLKKEQIEDAKKLFATIKLTDSPDHLSQPNDLRHLIWGFYEYLILGNTNFTTKIDLLAACKEYFDTNNTQTLF